MMPKKTNPIEKSIKKLKKLVSQVFLEGTYGVALRAKELSDYRSDGSTDVKADSRVKDLVGENVLPMLKIINYTLSVTSWTKRRPQPLSPWGEKGDEMVVVANVYPVTEGNETEVVKVENVFPLDRNNFKSVSTPVSNELLVRRNELTQRHFSEVRRLP